MVLRAMVVGGRFDDVGNEELEEEGCPEGNGEEAAKAGKVGGLDGRYRCFGFLGGLLLDWSGLLGEDGWELQALQLQATRKQAFGHGDIHRGRYYTKEWGCGVRGIAKVWS